MHSPIQKGRRLVSGQVSAGTSLRSDLPRVSTDTLRKYPDRMSEQLPGGARLRPHLQGLRTQALLRGGRRRLQRHVSHGASLRSDLHCLRPAAMPGLQRSLRRHLPRRSGLQSYLHSLRAQTLPGHQRRVQRQLPNESSLQYNVHGVRAQALPGRRRRLQG